MSDGTRKLCKILYGRDDKPADWVGGSEAKMLHDAAERIAQLESPWQPIETAPTDGTEVLLYRAKKTSSKNAIWPNVTIKARLSSGHYRNGWLWGGHVRDTDPTHWMPLPAPPKEGK